MAANISVNLEFRRCTINNVHIATIKGIIIITITFVQQVIQMTFDNIHDIDFN